MPKENKPFVDFRDIRSRITMEQVLAYYQVLDTFTRNGAYLIGPCPIHKGADKAQFRVDTERNVWNCFSECEHDGNVLDFVCRMERCPIHDAALKACEWFDIPVDEVSAGNDALNESVAVPSRQTESIQVPAPKPEDPRPNAVVKLRFENLEQEHPYLREKRGLSLETVVEFGLGCVAGNRGFLAGHVVIPINNVEGDIVAYAGLWPNDPPDEAAPTYKWSPGFRKSLEVFNLDRAIKEPTNAPLVIVADFFDAFRLHQHGCRKVVALMDSQMSVTQETLIRRHTSSKDRIVIMLDENTAGWAGGDSIAVRLSRHCFVKVHAPAGSYMNPKHLTPEQVQQLMEQVGI